MTNYAFDRRGLLLERTFKGVDVFMDALDAQTRIDAAVKIDNFAFAGLAHPHVVHLTWHHQFWDRMDVGESCEPFRGEGTYDYGGGALEYDYGSDYRIAFGYDHDDEISSKRTDFFHVDAVIQILEALQLRTVVGTRRGGLRCANGICRIFPNFAGVRGELVYRY